MLDIKFIRDNSELVKKNCQNRKVKVDIDKLLDFDKQKREKMQETEELRSKRNSSSKGKPSEDEIKQMREVGEKIKFLEEELKTIEESYLNLMLQVPNMTHKKSPIGGEDDFVVIEERGAIPNFDFEAKDHEELMINLDLVDFERGAKVSGSKFYFVKNDMVKLNQALLNYGMEILEKHGYNLIETPDLAKHEILLGAGFNPRGTEKQVYNLADEDLSLVGTAEITMLGFHADEILDLNNGPKKYTAMSHCFRTEAGAYGRTSKGLYRVHQFTKLEMFIFCKPEDSEKLHQELLSIEKEICDGLEIPYRVIDTPTGELGGPAFRKYDLEAWMTMKAEAKAKGGYGEITSTSNCTDYQARRLNIKYRNDEGKNEFVHTLNGTAVVLSRFPIAIIENNQQADGSIKIPKVLQKFVGKEFISKAK
ncbi:MAG: serine--tRNA ligase [Candidatus Magasanikbacteria bacterium CG_4_10_14_0_8_um_filter_32_14]|uniref:Serine--tRNA ligase n=2 Tax=Candidatus Magasanikiibacteriota TaxID=1752731 RepID=A0A2M7R8U2_9BACT|nr:MAG: serine--tRNA ligase [Candidatus Magasanikbacteria bacterium CG1_02_32_51]PIY93189.1 MAG: serine--tRNA ligase [Candidatus Magasanikbacteria bacterium CG_4_10_14_0_8_um_filter_32_14]